MSFKSDLSLGNHAEKVVGQVLTDIGIPVQFNEGKALKNLLKWDLSLDYMGQTYYTEIKYDKYEAKSGNIAIEFHNPKTKTLSGIFATTSDLWFHVLKSGIWVTRTTTLLDYCSQNKAKRIVAVGGDDNAAVFLFSSKSILPAIFDLFTPENGLEVLDGLLR